MRINMTSTLVPLLKSKVDELFLKWLSSDETQKSLQEDLNRILHGVSPAAFEPPAVSTVISSRPASPPAPPTPALSFRSPRSPKLTKKLNKSHSSKLTDISLTSLDGSDGHTAAIPRFYFPRGTPSQDTEESDDKIIEQVAKIFEMYDRGRIRKKDFSAVTKVSPEIIF